MNPLHQLLQLQRTDEEIQAKKQRLREVLLAQKGNETLEQVRRRRQGSEETFRDAQSRQKALEFELAQLDDKRGRSSDRLYSGKVKNPKELADLQQEIESLGRRRSELEDELLDVMMESEVAQQEDEEARAALQEVEAGWEEKRVVLSAEQDELATRVNALLAKRQKQADALEPKLLAAYESTRSKRGGVAMAPVQSGMCQACGVRVSSNKVSAAQNGDLRRCGSCDRILVIL